MFCILPNQLSRFSHRILSYKMSGDEMEDVSRGCFELDHVVLPTDMFPSYYKMSSDERKGVPRCCFELELIVHPTDIFHLT